MKLSIVIVARNEEKNIARCIESILKHAAGFGPFEVLLSDSASTDRTIEIASRYPINIISLRPEWPLSPSAGRFSGVNNVSGEYVLIIDGDMELLEGWVEKGLSFLDNHPNVASVVGRLYDVWGTSEGVYRGICRSSSLSPVISRINYISGSSLFRRRFLLKAGNFQPYLRAEEEAEVSFRLLKEGYDLYFLPEDAINHYTIPRNSLNETMRRIHKNLWVGMGDFLSWGLRCGHFGILWQRLRVFFFFSIVVFLAFLGLILSVFTKNHWWAVSSVAVVAGFVAAMCIKKRNVHQGFLSVLNMACITWFLWGGLNRKVLAIEKYPRDVVWVKRGGFRGSGF